MKTTILPILLIMISLSVFGQNSVDALRYSQTYNFGTSRFMAMGGAFGAVGADFSSLNVNPAGIGLFNKSVIVGTTALSMKTTSSSLNGNNESTRKDNLYLNNYGAVFATRINDNSSSIKGLQFGFGVNKLNDYNNILQVTNHNSTSSLITDYQVQAYNSHPDELDPFTTMLAWNSFLLWDTVRVTGNNLAYTSYLADGGTLQDVRVVQKGRNNEFFMNFGGNLKDKIYFGGSVGFPVIRYSEDVSHMEYDDADTIANFDSFTMNRYFSTEGMGVNIKIGIIARLNSFLRVGFAFHSPTWYSLSDTYHNEITSHWDNGENEPAESTTGNFDYSLTTPMKINGSVAFILKKALIISADVDYIDYSSAYLNSNSYSFKDENNDVAEKYQGTINTHFGVEYKHGQFAYRAGFVNYGSPFANSINDGSRKDISAGLGFSEGAFFMDLAYVRSMKSEDYYIYSPDLIDAAAMDYDANKVLFTVGVKF